MIASVSSRGHIIKVHCTDGGEVIQELKRGNTSAEISSIVFHPTKYLLACTSSNTTIHLFEIKNAIEKCINDKKHGFSEEDLKLEKNSVAANEKSGFKWMSFLDKYWDSDLCLSKIKVNEQFK